MADIRVELALGADPEGDPELWEWTDVSADRLRDQSVTITSGRADESGGSSPSTAVIELGNRDGALTPGDPRSPWYPGVRLGVPARLSVQTNRVYLRVPADGARVVTPTADELNISALDVRVELALDTIPAAWRDPAPQAYVPHEPAAQEIVGRYQVPDDQRSWRLLVGADGSPVLGWSPDGAALVTVSATEALPFRPGERFALRGVFIPDTGDGAHEVRWYTAPTLDGPWLPLGQPIRHEGATALYPADAPLQVGDISGLGFRAGVGRYYRLEVRDGEDGPAVAAPDFTKIVPGADEWTDSAGRRWSLVGPAAATTWRPRLVGQVAEWAPTWPEGDLSNRATGHPGEARVAITIAGTLRRLGQGAQALRSALARHIPLHQPAAYWPMEDGIRALWAASGLESQPPLALRPVDWERATDLTGSAALPTLKDGSWMRAPVPEQGTGQWRLGVLVRITGQWPEEPTQILAWRTSGTPWSRFELRVTHNAMQLWAFDEGDPPASQLMVNVFRPTASDQWRRWHAASWAQGGTVQVWIGSGAVGEPTLGSTHSYSGTVGDVTQVDTAFGSALAGAGVGHLVVHGAAGLDVYLGAETGFAGESAISRIRRLAGEEAVSVSAPGYAEQSTPMGPQSTATLLELLEECAAADGGILAERTTSAGLHYTPRHLLYGQEPSLALDAGLSEIAVPLAPLLDDQRVTNVMTVGRTAGSSATATDPDSVRAIGRYEDSVTLSLAQDEQAAQLAAWLLHRGTWPGMRYPEITTDLTVAPQCEEQWMDASPGARARITGLPPQHHGPVDVMLEGLREEISPARWSVTASCSPWGPWQAGEIAPPDDGPPTGVPTHVDTAGSRVDAAAEPSDFDLRVGTTDDQPWVTTSGPVISAEQGDLPVDIQAAGEVMTLTAVEPWMWDTWDRTLGSGWGTADSGHPWELLGGADSDRTVADGAGAVTLTGNPSEVRVQALPEVIHEVQIVATVSVSQLASGSELCPGLVVGFGGPSYYCLRLALTPGGGVRAQLTHDEAVLQEADTAYAYQPETRIRIRARITGTRLIGTVWPADNPVPPPQLDVDLGTIPAGRVGTAFSAAGATNAGVAASFRDLELETPQRFTVERCANGVSKPLPAGTDLRLADPIIIAL